MSALAWYLAGVATPIVLLAAVLAVFHRFVGPPSGREDQKDRVL